MQQLRYGGPVLLFARDLHDLDTDDFPKNLPRFAEKQLAGLHRRAVKRLAGTLKAPTPESAHRFRIALKHLRYSCEFFAPLFDNASLRTGTYRLRFDVAGYFKARGVALPEPNFLNQVSLDFGIAHADQHYHVPLLVSPWSYSTYRGS